MKNLRNLFLLITFVVSLTACSKPQTQPVPRDKTATTIKIVDKTLTLHKTNDKPMKPLNKALPHWPLSPAHLQPKPTVYTNLNTVLKNKQEND